MQPVKEALTGRLFLRHSAAKLMEMRRYFEVCLSKLDEERIWHRESEAQNSVGNLMLHLAGNVRQWIGSSVGGEPDIRDRPREFAGDSRIGEADLLAILNNAVAGAVGILKALPPSRLTEEVATQDGARTVLEVVYQVVGHFQQHTGQVIYATKRLTGEDLKFYEPSKKSS